MNNSFNDWMGRVARAAIRHTFDDGIYAGRAGAIRLARECGPALLDFPDGIKQIHSTYSGICVIAYNLKPPIDAKEWLTTMREAYMAAKEKTGGITQ